MNTSTAERVPKKSKATEIRLSKQRDSAEIDTLLWRIHARCPVTQGGHVIALTSCCRESGVSTMVANLATRAADNNMGPVLMIDANMTSSRLHRMFRQKVKFGLADVLAGTVSPAEAVVTTNVDGLELMTLGKSPKLEISMVFAENCEKLLQWARENYRVVLIDLPEIDDLRHGLMIARQADMTLVAIRFDAVRRSSAAQSIDRLKADGVNVSGTILTRQRIFAPRFLRG